MSELLKAFLQTGRLENVFVCDAHLHGGPVGGFYTGSMDFAAVPAAMGRLGVGLGIVSDINRYETPYLGNRRVEEYVRRWPGLLRGACFLTAAEAEGAEKELARCLATGLYSMVKLHPGWAGYEIDAPFYRRAYSMAAEAGLPVLVHTWGEEDMARMERLAAQHPNATFLVGHCGGTLGATKLAARLAASFENLYLDLTLTWPYRGLVEDLVAVCGAGKLLYGSDALWNGMEPSLCRVLYARVPDGDKLAILGGNARRLLPGLPG